MASIDRHREDHTRWRRLRRKLPGNTSSQRYQYSSAKCLSKLSSDENLSPQGLMGALSTAQRGLSFRFYRPRLVTLGSMQQNYVASYRSYFMVCMTCIVSDVKYTIVTIRMMPVPHITCESVLGSPPLYCSPPYAQRGAWEQG